MRSNLLLLQLIQRETLVGLIAIIMAGTVCVAALICISLVLIMIIKVIYAI